MRGQGLEEGRSPSKGYRAFQSEDQMGHRKGEVGVAGLLACRGRWQEKTLRSKQELHHVGGSGRRT